ncbi:MAG TPA: GSU2403 family nucleotidyltransferase fold protein [Burkholderiaceae bacterium]
MTYLKSEFILFSQDAGRVIANLETAYEQWLDARQQLARLPVSMYWKTVGDVEYLGVKINSNSTGTTGGARSPETEAEYEQFHGEKDALRQRVANADLLINERAGQYRGLRLPVLADRQAELLRALDIERLLRNDLLVVGTNAFCAYELLCNAKFPVGNEETENFDLAWCRGTKVSLASSDPESHRPLLSVLQGVDSTYQINPRKRYQAVNKDGYEVELLAAPSLAPLPKTEAFEPMYSLIEQEWLLKGIPVSYVVATVRRRACPVFVPDPRWMALHKLWLSRKPERRESKKPKDKRQGEVLLDACRYFLGDTYPLDIHFVLGLPPELRDLFDAWATERGYDPTKPDSGPDLTPPSRVPAKRRFTR